MTINNKILGLLGLCTKAGGICFGTDACIDLIMKKKIKLMIIAKDVSERTRNNIQKICMENNIKVISFGTIEEISKSIGKNNKAVVGIKNKDFALAIEKIINGGEIIG